MATETSECLDLYSLTIAAPRRAGDFAERAERAGWDGMAVVDSQNLSGDVYVALTVAASRTERLGLATAVTNPVTRHPAVTASAIASVHAFPDGRATLGIGRGDSSLAHLGRAPASVDVFGAYLDARELVQGREAAGERNPARIQTATGLIPFDDARFEGPPRRSWRGIVSCC